MPLNTSIPIRVTVLVISGSTMMTLASVIDPLRAANRLSPTPVIDWNLRSADGQDVTLSGGLRFPVSEKFRSGETGDLLIVTASFEHQRHAPAELIATLRQAARGYARICGVEAGTWLLARAGMIDGVEVTTHWEDLENLQHAYPQANVSDARFLADGRIWTCGGASPAFDMMLHLIEQACSPALALEVASVFVYDQLHTASDRQPATSLGMLEHNEPRLAQAIRIMERNLDAPITTSAISTRLGLGVKTLETLFHRSLRTTPGAYYLDLRLQMARKQVLDTQLSMQDIAVRTGFGSQSAFSRAFSRKFGSSPLRLRQNRP